MRSNNKASIVIGLLLAGSISPSITIADVRLLTEGDSGGWIKPDQAIRISIDPQPKELAVFIGSTDVSSFFSRQADGTYIYDATALALPFGSNELKVYDKAKGSSNWEELGNVELNVLTKNGFSVSKVTPSVEVNINSKLSDSRSGDAEEPDRKTFTDFDSSITFESEHKRTGGLQISSSSNIVSTSNREAALRFDEKENDAPKVDLSEYVVTAVKGKTKIQLGHISQGSHPLLVDNLSNRGITIDRQLTDRVSVALSHQSGREITGYSHILGFTTHKSKISTFTVGFDLLRKRPGGAKLEVSYLTGTRTPESNFDEGQVPTAEDSSGYGVRLTTNSKSGKLTTDLAYARSKYTNPTEETPEFNGEAIVDVKPTTNNAYYALIGYQLLTEKKLSNNITADLSVNIRYAKVDSEYRSLAASPNPDERLKEIGLTGRVAKVDFQLKHSRSRDNLENIASILTTQTNTSELSISTSLKELFGVTKAGDPNRYNKLLPSLSLSAQRVSQYALNSPKTENSDFNDNSHLPDQLNLILANSLEWEFDKWGLGYQTEWSDQDNRQVGRENADFQTLGHQVSLTLRPRDSITVALSAGRVRTRDVEQSTKRYDNTYGINLDWQLNDKFTLSASHSKNRSKDNIDISKSLSISNEVKLSYQLSIPVPSGKKLPGQMFIRYAKERASNSNTEQEFESSASNSAVFAGINFSF